MGTGTALTMAGLSLASGIGNYKSAKSSIKAIEKEAYQKMADRRKEIQRLIAEQKIGYGTAGVELEGTPQTVIRDTYNIGIQDINAIASSYNTAIRNATKQAKAGLLGSIVGAGVQGYSIYNKLNSPLKVNDESDGNIFSNVWNTLSNLSLERESYPEIIEDIDYVRDPKKDDKGGVADLPADADLVVFPDDFEFKR
jgi:hypothetical protein